MAEIIELEKDVIIWLHRKGRGLERHQPILEYLLLKASKGNKQIKILNSLFILNQYIYFDSLSVEDLFSCITLKNQNTYNHEINDKRQNSGLILRCPIIMFNSILF